MTAHSELVARLDGASEGSRELDAEIADLFDPVPDQYDGFRGRWPFVEGSPFSDQSPPVTTSLDAALALAERVLDVWCTVVESSPKSDHPSGNRACAQINLMGGGGTDRIAAPTPALALCIAILKATTANSVGTEAEGRSAPSIPPVKTGEGGT